MRVSAVTQFPLRTGASVPTTLPIGTLHFCGACGAPGVSLVLRINDMPTSQGAEHSGVLVEDVCTGTWGSLGLFVTVSSCE